VPYRIDLDDSSDRALAIVIDLDALDVERTAAGIAAILPDAVAPATVARALGVPHVRVSPAVGRDDDSVWTLLPRPIRTRTLSIVPAGTRATAGALHIADSRAFGTGLHATTALCLDAIDDVVDAETPAAMLDVGTGSGILALAALRRGVHRVVGLDVDPIALGAAAENATLNGLTGRMALVRGGADAVRGFWPLVVANIRAADLIEMGPILVRRVSSAGWLVLSGIPRAVAPDVQRTYQRLGMKSAGTRERDGWTALMLRPSW
jgi:ribosomal protein L11 methyltransferase